MTAQQLLDNALALTDSDSTREWVNTPHNRPLFEQIAQGALDKNSQAEPARLACYITCLKIGL